MDNYIDLHMHSLYSDDGEFTVKELVDKCNDNGIKIMAIADHNSIKAIDDEIAYTKEVGIVCIPAIEIDCTYNDLNLHVLGYGIDHNHNDFTLLEENVIDQELSASALKLELVNKLGFNLTGKDLEHVSSNGVWTGEMFGEVLLDKEEYANYEILLPYRKGGSRDDNPYVNFYWDYFAQGKPCYTKIVYPSLKETITLINNHGGVAVLAHPGNNLKNQLEIFDEMIKLGIQGVEAFSSYHDENTISYFYQKAKENNLLVTCGSDYHGKTKPSINIGGSKCNINQTEIENKLKELKLI